VKLYGGLLQVVDVCIARVGVAQIMLLPAYRAYGPVAADNIFCDFVLMAAAAHEFKRRLKPAEKLRGFFW